MNMGRSRWRLIAVALLLVATRHAICQDANEFYYTPVERSFAQIQPPLFPNSRPTTYFENANAFGVQQPGLVNVPQQHLYNDGRTGFPAPNYNQHPSPFQLSTGKSQSNSQFFINPADFNSAQRQRFRPSFPHNYQLVHPASTRRPDTSQIHSVAYQNDPSKPETFLGQITLNNPDIDFLQNNKFKNTPFNDNSLKNVNHHNHGVPIDVDDDDDVQDLFEHHKVTTYNPTKLTNRLRLTNRPPFDPVRQYETMSTPNTSSLLYLANNSNFGSGPSRTNDVKLSSTTQNPKLLPNLYSRKSPRISTDYKTLHDIEPLLEDDISDLNSFKELMKNNQGSLDVQVIKSSNEEITHDSEKYDSNPSASSMDMSNVSKELPQINATFLNLNFTSTTETLQDLDDISKENHYNLNTNSRNNESKEEEIEEQHGETEDDSEYVEYYDETENTETEPTTKRPTTTIHPDIYDEYDSTEENDHSDDDIKTNVTKSFDILITKPNSTTMNEDNFRDFIDTTVIDHIEDITDNGPIQDSTEITTTEEISTVDTPSILGQEVVSVVTTKSVVNGTISVPDYSYTSSSVNPSTPSGSDSSKNIFNNSSQNYESSTENPTINTTENWIVVASVQTSRSVSGARFLPFPTVEQEEKKQVLTETEEDYEDDKVTRIPKDENEENTNKESNASPPENINDKLDVIQSELSSVVLGGSLDDESKNITLITESIEKDMTTTTPTSLNVFTLKSTHTSPTTEKSSPEPLPVLIKKFTPRTTTTTTPKPKRKPSLVTVMDDIAGLLPPGYKPRQSYKDKRISTTTTIKMALSTTTATPHTLISSTEDDSINGTQPRSSGISSKNKVIILDDKTLLPRDYKPRESSKQRDELLKNVKEDEINKFLPPGFKLNANDKHVSQTKTSDISDRIKKVDVSTFLSKEFQNKTSTTEKSLDVSKLLANAAPVDISAFLPPDFKTNDPKKENNSFVSNFKIADISSLIPPGFHLNNTSDSSESTSIKPSSNGFKVVFPSRPGSKNTRKTTTPKSNTNLGPSPVTPKIQKGWPTRASTEFTGWPTPSTTPFSIEKLLEAQRNATATTRAPELSTESTTRRITTTTTTTALPPPSTTPGMCRHECDLAATIKIIAGVKWVPELLDHHTQEWKSLAKDVKEELNSVYSKTDQLKKWYKGIRIDAFSKGSVLVDYFIELNGVEGKVDTLYLKKIFHNSLNKAKPGSVVETVTEKSNEEFDPDVMLGDQPEEDRMKKSNEKMTKVIDKSAGKLEMGKFVMDPAYTEFIVLPKRDESTAVQNDEESFLPQWGIAVIVIALASLLFVVIFGVTVLINRQKSAKAKQPIPLSEDMLRELDKSHMGGFDEIPQLKERELPYIPQGKRMSTAFIEQLSYQNPGDSWRSEWTPQLQKYMQHYTPDSGRGSQIYGAPPNLYGYSGSQVYGQAGGGGGGSQLYGHTGDYPRSHHSRRRSHYEDNF